jgi:hypothetical protein
MLDLVDSEVDALQAGQGPLHGGPEVVRQRVG